MGHNCKSKTVATHCLRKKSRYHKHTTNFTSQERCPTCFHGIQGGPGGGGDLTQATGCVGCSKGEEADAVDVCASEFVDEADEVHRATHKDELPRDKLRRQRRARVFFERGMDSWRKKKGSTTTTTISRDSFLL